MMVQSLLFAGACTLVFGGLSLMPRHAQILVLVLLGAVVVWVAVVAALLAEPLMMLGALMLTGLLAGLDAMLVHLRNSPSREAPGAPLGAGDAGERDGERNAPILPGGQQTAGRAGRPRAFSEGAG